jgi:hypothetical protein
MPDLEGGLTFPSQGRADNPAQDDDQLDDPAQKLQQGAKYLNGPFNSVESGQLSGGGQGLQWCCCLSVKPRFAAYRPPRVPGRSLLLHGLGPSGLPELVRGTGHRAAPGSTRSA